MAKKGLDQSKKYGIFDIDGTLSVLSEREVYAVAGLWDEFNKRCSHDKPNSAMVAICNAWSENTKKRGTIVLTGRSDKWISETRYWLTLWNVEYDVLIMRPEGDKRSDYVFKRDIVGNLRAAGVKITFAFDDRDSCKEMFEEEGITCFSPPKKSLY